MIPELLRYSGQVLHPQKLKLLQNPLSQYSGMGIPPKKTLSCYLIAKLSWQNNLLQLQATFFYSSQVPINPDYFWSYEPVQRGTYQLRFTYLSPQGEFLFFDAHLVEISEVQASVTSLLTTPWVNLQLVEPVGTNKNAVEVDGIRFETVMPEGIWNISCFNLPDVSLSTQIGIRITNNKSIQETFCSKTTLIPTLIGAGGLILGQNLGGGSHGWVSPTESDFHACCRGESVTFFVNAHVEKRTDGLLNLIVDGTGYGYWSFNGLKSGIYQIRLIYRSLTNQFMLNLFEDFWKGMVLYYFYDNPGRVDVGWNHDWLIFDSDETSEKPKSTTEPTSALGLITLLCWGIIRTLKIKKSSRQ